MATLTSINFICLVLFLNSFVKTEFYVGKNDLVGLFPPLFTAFNDDYSLNLGVIPAYAKLMVDHGVEGVVLCGTNGEGPVMTYDERVQVVDAWYDVAKMYGLQIMVLVSGQPFPDTLRMAKYADQKGIEAILVLPELYYRPQSTRELVDYLAAIARQAPNTALLYYDIRNTHVDVNLSELFKLATKEIPTFVGLKCTLDDALEVLRNVQLKSYQRIFTRGIQGILMKEINGTIGGAVSVFPAELQYMRLSVRQGHPQRARRIYDYVNTQIAALSVYDENNETAITVAEFKAGVNLITKIRVGPTRPPLPQISRARLDEMKRKLRAVGVKVNDYY